MTKEQLAAKLNGREYPFEMTKQESADAKANGLIVAFGASDDLLELEGALSDEVGAYNGAEAYIRRDGVLLIAPDDDEMEVLEKFDFKAAIAQRQSGAIKVTAKWCPPELKASWLIEANVPHANFDIMEDGELFCRAIVIDLKELQS